MGKKKQFIDKKVAATFKLMPRDCRGDEDDSERVFVRVDNNDLLEEVSPEIPESPHGKHAMSDKRRQQLLEMGFPDDGYDYFEHMRTIGVGDYVAAPHTSGVDPDVKAYDASNVPVTGGSDVVEFPVLQATEIRSTKVLVKGLDPEVAAALDAEEISEAGSDLEDDFILVANKDVIGETSTSFNEEPFVEDHSDEEEPEVVSTEIVTKIYDDRKNAVLDEEFELLAENEYDDASDLDDDEIDPRARGHADISHFKSVLSDFLTKNSSQKYKTESEEMDAKALPAPEAKAAIKKAVYDYSSEEEEVEVSDDEDRHKWDCETIVSTMSNLENHPAKIGAPGGVRLSAIMEGHEVNGPQRIRIGGKQKLPLDFLPKKTAVAAPKEDGLKPENAKKTVGWETPEERKARKTAVKEEKRASRQVKKELRTKYKSEGHRAQHGAAVMGPKTIRLP